MELSAGCNMESVVCLWQNDKRVGLQGVEMYSKCKNFLKKYTEKLNFYRKILANPIAVRYNNSDISTF